MDVLQYRHTEIAEYPCLLFLRKRLLFSFQRASWENVLQSHLWGRVFSDRNQSGASEAVLRWTDKCAVVLEST